MNVKQFFSSVLWISFIGSTQVLASDFSTSLDYAQVMKVDAVERTDNTWCFYTQVRHNDQGWEHYADHWEVADLEGNVLGERRLAHPHNKEQPFTRNQCGINIPSELTRVIVRAKCNKHGFGGKAIIVDLNQSRGDGFSVKRR